jgi:hypothetical protein
LSISVSDTIKTLTGPQTMQSNKEDLFRLEKCLRDLTAVDVLGTSEDLKGRLVSLTSCVFGTTHGLVHSFVVIRNLTPIAAQCRSLAEKRGIKQFFKSRDYKEKIQDIKNLIASHIQEFTVGPSCYSSTPPPSSTFLQVLRQYFD